jgi:Domain of unknown function (DUF2935)
MCDDHSKILFEHLFWLQILGDHSRFIFNNLSPKETSEIARAASFIDTFNTLLDNARQITSSTQLDLITSEALTSTNQLRDFKLHLLCRHLVGEIAVHLPPTFFNHMLNELEEYLRILEFLQCGQCPPLMHSLHHDLVWLLDAVGHAASLASTLDEVELSLIDQSELFKKHFRDLHYKALEFKGSLRTGLQEFPALSRLNFEVRDKIVQFMDFLSNIKASVVSKETLGALAPLVPDHMLREECYFLIKLAEVSGIVIPPCDPTSPRLS